MHLYACSHRQPTTRLHLMVHQRAQAALGEEDHVRVTRTATTTLYEIWKIAHSRKASWVRTTGNDELASCIDQNREENGAVCNTEMRRSKFCSISLFALLPQSSSVSNIAMV